MKGLVLLYRCNDEVTIREFEIIGDYHNHYIIGKNWLDNREGILKKYVGKVCQLDWSNHGTYEGTRVCIYPVELPYMSYKWSKKGIYFMFINKTKYDADPAYYYDMIKNYTEKQD